MLDPFETLGIDARASTSISRRSRSGIASSRGSLHPDRHVAGSPAERRLALGRAVEVNEAWRALRDPMRRAEALLRRHGVRVEEGNEPKPDPEFLMEMMEQREALSEARAASGPRPRVGAAGERRCRDARSERRWRVSRRHSRRVRSTTARRLRSASFAITGASSTR